MSEPPAFRPIDLALVILIFAVAAGVRGGYLLACADSGRDAGPIVVQDPSPADRAALVGDLKDSASFSINGVRTASIAPGYPWLLSLAARASDPGRAMRWVQVALGALTAVLYLLFARRAFGSLAVAALAGLFCALHPFWVVSTAQLEDGVTAAFLLALAVWLGARGGQSGGALTSLLHGLALAGLALVRPALLPFAFVAVLWFLWRCRSLSRGWLYALLAFLGFANALIPWTLRNYQLTGEVVPVVDTAWHHLWVGNNPDAAEPHPGQLPRELMEGVRRDPTATLNRRAWAGLGFVFGEDWLRERTTWRSEASADELPPWLAGSYSAILIGALLGMLLLAFAGWRWSYGWRQAVPAALAVAWVPLPYLLSHAEGLSGPRLPLDGVLLCYAAFALVYVLPRVGARLRQGPVAQWNTD
jgi:4-amino-4-deoxy-L-arabinose transferase-like glycosyltransferase